MPGSLSAVSFEVFLYGSTVLFDLTMHYAFNKN